jgi:hypothetical protein
MRTALIGITIALLLAGGCKQKSSQTAAVSGDQALTQSSLTPEQLGEIGAKIKKQPSEAQKILSDNGLTEESFENAIRKVSEDPQASKRYAEAYKRASA